MATEHDRMILLSCAAELSVECRRACVREFVLILIAGCGMPRSKWAHEGKKISCVEQDRVIAWMTFVLVCLAGLHHGYDPSEYGVDGHRARALTSGL